MMTCGTPRSVAIADALETSSGAEHRAGHRAQAHPRQEREQNDSAHGERHFAANHVRGHRHPTGQRCDAEHESQIQDVGPGDVADRQSGVPARRRDPRHEELRRRRTKADDDHADHDRADP